MLGREIQPELAHLEHAARLLEVRAVELLVDDPARGGHPLHVPGSDDVPVPHESPCSTSPLNAMVMVSNPRCGCCPTPRRSYDGENSFGAA